MFTKIGWLAGSMVPPKWTRSKPLACLLVLVAMWWRLTVGLTACAICIYNSSSRSVTRRRGLILYVSGMTRSGKGRLIESVKTLLTTTPGVQLTKYMGLDGCRQYTNRDKLQTVEGLGFESVWAKRKIYLFDRGDHVDKGMLERDIQEWYQNSGPGDVLIADSNVLPEVRRNHAGPPHVWAHIETDKIADPAAAVAELRRRKEAAWSEWMTAEEKADAATARDMKKWFDEQTLPWARRLAALVPDHAYSLPIDLTPDDRSSEERAAAVVDVILAAFAQLG